MFDLGTLRDLETTRLVLRALVPGDAADVFAFRGDHTVQRFNSEPLKNVDEAPAFLAELERRYSTGEAIHWGITIRPDQRVVGSVGLSSIDRYHRRAEVGYDLARLHWGRGIGREAVSAVLGFGFTDLNLHRVDARTIRDNYESVRMLEALGFQREAILREYSLEDDGLFHDSTVYGLLDREFALHQRR
jgi:[ribosomal protein S5]-alanine N-acetyltransferase